MIIGGSAPVPPSHNNQFHQTGGGTSYEDYVFKAMQACRFGNEILGMHLYLAAFARAQYEGGSAAHDHCLDSLRRAWELACQNKQRPIAEYIFENIESYLTVEEKKGYLKTLRELVIDRLEECGVPASMLQEMDAFPSALESSFGQGGFAPVLRPPAHAAVSGPSTEIAAARGDSLAASSLDAGSTGAPNEKSALQNDSSRGESESKKVSKEEYLRYSDLVGYDEAIKAMSATGLIRSRDPEYQALIKQLNARHGLDRQPSSDTFIFRALAREDATKFMSATLGELDLPAVRMRMEEGIQGAPVLCVMTYAANQPKLGPNNSSFEGPGVLLLEDLDLWTVPMRDFNAPEDMSNLLMMSLTRGAREIVNLIHSAVTNPDVYVLASASQEEIDPFFFDFLGPLTVVDIDLPTEKERRDIWQDLAKTHPSLRHIDRDLLVRYSANMPRCDIAIAADEAIDEAYQASLLSHHYVEVTSGNLFDKLAAYQPLESEEYGQLEEEVINSFRYGLGSLEDILNEGWS